MGRGDQIYAMRTAGIGTYEHHGIDCGDGTVIHYSKAKEPAEVARTSRESFGRSGPIYPRFQPAALPPDTVIQRAESRLGERRYDLFSNNCEHFATWCTTGRSQCPQLEAFGLPAAQLRRPELQNLIEQTAHDRSPELAVGLFHRALGDIATVYDDLHRQHQQAQADMDVWHQVAQRALQQQRPDLARGALHKKVAAKQRRQRLSHQLQEMVELRLNLLKNHQRWST